MTPCREHMSPVDTAWLRMERPNNLMMIGTVLTFETPLNIDRFKEIIVRKLLKYNRFTQKAVDKKVNAYWIDDPDFNIDHHIHQLKLTGNGSKKDLQDLASRLVSTQLDFSKPLWQIHIIEKYQQGSAIIFRLHHAIADGISLVAVMLSLMDGEPDMGPAEHLPSPQASSLPDAKASHTVRPPRENPLFVSKLLHNIWELIKAPKTFLALTRKAGKAMVEIVRVLTTPNDPASCFKGELSGHKRVSWIEPLPLAEVKSIAKKLDTTINNVLLTVATGAIRSYLSTRQEKAVLEKIHVVVPFNLRPADESLFTLGNRFGLLIAALPTGTKDPMLRFSRVRNTMEALKESHQAQVFYGLLKIIGKGPAILEQKAIEVLSKKASLVITNVPGPQKPMYMAGAKLKLPMAWVPQTGEVGVGLSLFSYCGEVHCGVIADKHLIPDPNQLADHFLASYAELKQIVLDLTS